VTQSVEEIDSKVKIVRLNKRVGLLAVVAFLMPFSMSVWQFFDADSGRQLLSPFIFSDASLYHYSAWYKFVFSEQSYVSKLIAFSPYERVLTESFKIFGYSTVTSFAINAVLSGLTCLMIVLVTWQLFTVRAAWFAIFIYSFSTPILFFSGLTLKTMFVLFLTSSALLLAVLYFKKRAVYLSVGFSLLILTASIDRIHVLVGLVIFLVFLCWPSSNAQHSRQYRLSAASVVLVVALALFVSNMQYGAEPRYVSNVGLNIYLGHSKPDNFLLEVQGVRNHIIGHREDSRKIAERHAQKQLSQAEVTGYWVRQALDYIKNNPELYLRGQVQKMHHIFSAQSASFVGERAYLWRDQRWPLRFTFIDFALIFSLFVVASVALLKRRQMTRQEGFLLVFCVVYLFSLMATIVIERYRMVALVCMIPMAAWGLAYLSKSLVERWRLLIIGVLVFFASHLLAFTAPSDHKLKYDEHLLREKKADNNRHRRFHAAKTEIESNLNLRTCANFQRQLKKNKYYFDLSGTGRVCGALRKKDRLKKVELGQSVE